MTNTNGERERRYPSTQFEGMVEENRSPMLTADEKVSELTSILEEQQLENDNLRE